MQKASTVTIANSLLFSPRTKRGLDKDLTEYNIRARAYDPTYGHFLSRDPLGLDAGWNLYRYANTQPTVLVDPSGMLGKLVRTQV